MTLFSMPQHVMKNPKIAGMRLFLIVFMVDNARALSILWHNCTEVFPLALDFMKKTYKKITKLQYGALFPSFNLDLFQSRKM